MLLGFISLVTSCKKDTNGGGGNGSGNSLTLTLSQSLVSLSAPQNVYVSVKDQNNNDVTAACAITANGAPVIGAVYAPTTAGTFAFVATKDGVSSPAANLVVTPVIVSTDSVFVSLSSPTLEFNGFDYVTITVKDKNGADITSTSQIYLNGSTLVSSQYVADATGNYTVTASKNGSPSNAKTLNVVAKTASPFSQKILVEDCTGTWCGFCPRVANELENYKATHPNCIVVGVHSGGSGQPDPFKYQYYSNLGASFGVTGYPAAILNRAGTWGENNSELNTALSQWAPLGLAINSTVSGTNVTGTVKVKYNVTTNRKMKIVIALVENGLVYPQTNYYSTGYGYTPYLYGGVSPVTNFVHNGVMRKAATDLFGDSINVAAQFKNNEYSLPFSISLSGPTANGTTYNAVSANCSIVAFVIDGTSDNNGVYNVQSAPVGTNKNYD